MQRRQTPVNDLNIACLEINNTGVFIYVFGFLQLIETGYLNYCIQKKIEFCLLCNNYNIQQTISQACFWSDCKIITILIAIGDANKIGIELQDVVIQF